MRNMPSIKVWRSKGHVNKPSILVVPLHLHYSRQSRGGSPEPLDQGHAELSLDHSQTGLDVLPSLDSWPKVPVPPHVICHIWPLDPQPRKRTQSSRLRTAWNQVRTLLDEKSQVKIAWFCERDAESGRSGATIHGCQPISSMTDILERVAYLPKETLSRST